MLQAAFSALLAVPLFGSISGAVHSAYLPLEIDMNYDTDIGPPPPLQIDASPSGDAGAFAGKLQAQSFLPAGNETHAFLTRLLESAVASGATGKVLEKLIDRALPPAPSRAESWWMEEAVKFADRLPEPTTMEDIAKWLVANVKAGCISPSVAAELIGYFRVLEVAGGFNVAAKPRVSTLRSVAS